MGLFRTAKPKSFEHKYIFVDERKEKLQKIEEKAKRELGMLPPKEESTEERLRGRFVRETRHLKRRKEEGVRFSTQKLIVALLLLLFLLHYLITGSWTF